LYLSLPPVTGIFGVLTVTVQVAVSFPSAVVTVITAVPALTPNILPFTSTIATALLLDFQVTFLSEWAHHYYFC
jgi:hypothetical protein